MSQRRSAREAILKAAAEIVREQGALHMTMDAIAAKAGVSKGGLIYHFPSQRDLLRAMLMGHIQHVEAQIARCRARLPSVPARDIKAFIQAWFDLDEEFRRSANALLAVVLREPDLIAAVRSKHREIANTILANQPKNELLLTLLLAVEGVWISELLGVDILTKDERRQAKRTLLQLADEWTRPTETRAPQAPARCPGKKGPRKASDTLRKERNP